MNKCIISSPNHLVPSYSSSVNFREKKKQGKWDILSKKSMSFFFFFFALEYMR